MTGFQGTTGETLGVEEEFQLVDPETGQLVSRVPHLFERAGLEEKPGFQLEAFQAMVETATPVCQDIDQVEQAIEHQRGVLCEMAEEEGLALAAAGTHPMAKWEEQRVTQKQRYLDLLDDIGMPFKRDLVFGQHIHVGVGSKEHAMAVHNGLRPVLPLILALSTNSPYWRGLETGLDSVRVRVFEGMPRSGFPQAFDGWSDLERTLDALLEAGAIKDLSYVWWDLRPRPAMGTVEVRLPDVSTDHTNGVALTGLIQVLVQRIARAHRAREHIPFLQLHDVIAENRWRALRDGPRASFIARGPDSRMTTLPVIQVLEDLLVWAQPEVEALGMERHMDRLRRRASTQTTGATRQRRIFERTGDLVEVVRDIAERTPP